MRADSLLQKLGRNTLFFQIAIDFKIMQSHLRIFLKVESARLKDVKGLGLFFSALHLRCISALPFCVVSTVPFFLKQF